MALYFDYNAKCPYKDSVHVGVSLHEKHPLLAVSSFNDDNGGFIFICNEEGELLEGVSFPTHPSAQVTSLAWHPTRLQLAIGWENGNLQVWTDGQEEFISVDSPHRDPVILLRWSNQGLRLVSADTTGSVIGWKADTRGKLQTVFHHELKDPVSQITFRRTSASSAIEFSGLARAAVAGDEKALDMFSDWRPKTAGQRNALLSEQNDNLCFFSGSISGVIYYIKDSGSCEEVLRVDGTIKKLLYHESKDYLVVMTDKLNISQFHVDNDGKISEIMKVKINGRSSDASLVWAGEGLLAFSAGEPTVRCWDLETGENYVLPMEVVGAPSSTQPNSSTLTHPNEFFTSVAYYDKKRSLCGSTNLGRVFMWKFMPPSVRNSSRRIGVSDKEDDGQWVRLGTVGVEGGAIVKVQWGGGRGVLAVHTVTGVCLLCEHPVATCYNNKMAAVQVSPSEFLIQHFEEGWIVPVMLNDVRAIGVAIGDNHFVFWDNKKVVVYEISEKLPERFRISGSFACKCEDLVVYNRSLYALETVLNKEDSEKENTEKNKEEVKVRCHTFQGTVTSTLNILEEEGEPAGIHLTSPFIVVFTLLGVVKIWDISRREAKIHAHPKKLDDVIPDFGEVISAKCNSDGTKMSLTVAKSNLFPDSKLYIWNINTDSFSYLNFSTGEMDENNSGGSSSQKMNKDNELISLHEKAASTLAVGMFGRFVLSHYWDRNEPKLLVCEAKILPSQRSHSSKSFSSKNSTNNLFRRPEVVLVTLFSTPDGEILIQNSVPFPEKNMKLLGVEIPHFILLKRPTSVDEASGCGLSERKVMRDFEGLEECDKATRDAVVNFSYFLSMGNMDEAFRAIKTIKSGAIWENMARMCVETKQVDVGAVCLGHMGNALGARALRNAAGAVLDVRVAVLAMHLGLTAEAEKLLNGCGRYDLLNKLYQDSNRWELALQVAEELDRIHLRSTCYNYAKHLEAQGDISQAIIMYERSETHRTEVPRMLAGHEELLESYMKQTKDQTLGSWWGKRLESKGEIKGALTAYEEVDDRASQVRLHCRFLDDIDAAEKAAGSDPAALFELAREFEKRGKFDGAVRAFTRAHAYGNAIRVCKENDMTEELWSVALTAGPNDQLDAGRYFENADPPAPEKTVHLYHRAGLLHMALELAFRTQQYNALQYIAMDLNSNSDPMLLQKCAAFFIQNKQYEKAVDLLAVAKQYKEALDLCMEHDIPLTDELAEKLTSVKGEKASGDGNLERSVLLEKLAEIAVSQGRLQLAAKKYTQAGNKIKAMKVLLRLGDPEKIVFFANVSRQREIYVMAANYLQSLDWQNEPSIMRNIITFYTKGRAPHLLSSFYVACAEVEIDEFQNYEKALSALEEAKVCLTRTISKGGIGGGDDIRSKGEEIDRRTQLVRQFVEIQSQYKQDPEASIQRCRVLLEEWQVSKEDAVRRGDVYAFVAEHYARQGNEEEVLRLLREMREVLPTGTSLAYYVDTAALSKLSSEVASMLKNDRRESRSMSRASAIHAEEDEIAEEEIEVVKEEVEEEEMEERLQKEDKTNPVFRSNGKIYAI